MLAHHKNSKHPHCSCVPDNFHSVNELLDHFSMHTLKNQVCPACPIKFERLQHAVTHIQTYKGSSLHLKGPCEVDIGLMKCQEVEIDGYKHLSHILQYHITDLEHLKAVSKVAHQIIVLPI